MSAQAHRRGQPQPTQRRAFMLKGVSMAVFSGPGLRVTLRTPNNLTSHFIFHILSTAVALDPLA